MREGRDKNYIERKDGGHRRGVKGEEKKIKVVFPTGGCEATNWENTKALYASVRLWGTEEEDIIPFPYWKGFYEYQEPIDPTSISSNFAAVFTKVASLLNSRVERTVILNVNTQENNEFLGDKINETVKLHRMERSMEESVSKSQSLVDTEQRNCGPQKNNL